jgi:catechol 2,3-dioxygenase-like lactoylglutathione lyase family enzyme
MISFKQIKETCLYLSNLDQAYDFYHGKLEMPVISRVEGRHIFFRVGSSVLLCFVPEATKNEQQLPPHYAYGPQHIAFEVDPSDYQEVKAKVEKSGINITHLQPWKKGKFESFYFEDPEQNVLEIIPSGMWE